MGSVARAVARRGEARRAQAARQSRADLSRARARARARKTHLWRIDFLVLAGDEQRAHADQLQLVAVRRVAHEVPVEDVDAQPEREGLQLEAVVHLDQPVDQNGAHFLVDVLLRVHVGLGRVLLLRARARAWASESAR